MSNSTPIDKDWKAVHEELACLAAKRAELDADEGRCMLAALRAGVHGRLGYGSFQEYIERLFGYSPRFVSERLRVARALEEMPHMQEALATGALCWSAARELTRVATLQTQDAWLEAACGKSVREIEQLLSGLAPGALPGDRPQRHNERHVLRLELSAETLATYREAIAKLQRESGESGAAGLGRGLDEDAAVLLMARAVLEGPKDSGRSGYQIALSVCPHCGEGAQHGRGEAVHVSAEVVEMAACDAQVLPPVADAPDAAQPLAGASSHGRATQSIPPAVRREVMRRDGGRCRVPGCRNATFVDVHHVLPRADGGTHDPRGLIVLCAAHHRLAHRGSLFIEHDGSCGLRFLHADGSAYGALEISPAVAEVMRDSFSALRQLGFGETQVRQALAAVRTSSGTMRLTDTAQVIRAALRELTGPAVGSYVSKQAASKPLEVREAPAVYGVFPTREDQPPVRHLTAMAAGATADTAGARAA